MCQCTNWININQCIKKDANASVSTQFVSLSFRNVVNYSISTCEQIVMDVFQQRNKMLSKFQEFIIICVWQSFQFVLPQSTTLTYKFSTQFIQRLPMNAFNLSSSSSFSLQFRLRFINVSNDKRETNRKSLCRAHNK